MSRPRTPLNSYGSISTTAQVKTPEGRWVTAPKGVKPDRWKARTRHRDDDGEARDVTKYGDTKGAAVSALKNALVQRSAPAQEGVMRPEMTVRAAAELWLSQAERQDSALSANTRQQYRANFGRYIADSRVASLTLREVNRVAVLERWLQEVADKRGTGAAKTARSVLSNVLGLAVRYQALPHNAMRDVRPAKAQVARESVRDTRRAFTIEERERVLLVADEHPGARSADVSDLIWFIAGTGVRISEALECTSWVDVDLRATTVRIRGTKTASADRELHMPPWLVERLEARAKAHGRNGLVFSSPGTNDPLKPRDRRNVTRVIRNVLDAAEVPWATTHTLRRTVATMLDAAGQPIALAANQLGHADPSMTARVYLNRKASTAAAAGIL